MVGLKVNDFQEFGKSMSISMSKSMFLKIQQWQKYLEIFNNDSEMVVIFKRYDFKYVLWFSKLLKNI